MLKISCTENRSYLCYMCLRSVLRSQNRLWSGWKNTIEMCRQAWLNHIFLYQKMSDTYITHTFHT